MEKARLSSRPLVPRDLPLLMDYWYGLSDSQLVNLGVALDKFPVRAQFEENIREQLSLPVAKRQSFAMIWEINGKASGHNNINSIEPGLKAKMHLHLWRSELQKKGLGCELLKISIPAFFKNYDLQYLLCEPYAHNTAPNRVLEKLGFTFVKKYTTIPGSINFEQEVNQWSLSREACNKICKR